VETFADDVNTVITKLKLKRVILVGSSMGGPIVLEATRRMPERVVAIVPVDTLQNVEFKLPPEQLDAVFKQLRADYKGAMMGFLNQMLFSPSTPATVKTRITSQVTSQPPELAIAILKGVLAYDSVPALKEVKVPIHAINADMNPLTWKSIASTRRSSRS
jgi:pimeloyl-ACP methyl ester carboxylesterase